MHMEMSEEHDRGVPEPGFIGTTIQDSNFINSDVSLGQIGCTYIYCLG